VPKGPPGIAICVAPSTSGAPKQATPASAVPSPEVRRDNAMRQLASEPLEIVGMYEVLASPQKDKADRMRAYGELPSSMNADAWRHQLLTALAEHPEFRAVQGVTFAWSLVRIGIVSAEGVFGGSIGDAVRCSRIPVTGYAI
jgi:hypothetical protein